MVEDLLELLVALNSGFIGDWADRVNCFTSFRVFLVLGTLVVTRQFVGESIICWSPNEFNSQWQQYVDSYCWVMNTNYLPLTSHHDAIIDGYAPRLIRYYQWTPLILFTQALLFLVPNFLWQTAYRSSGMDFERVVEFASRFETIIDQNEWKSTVARLARHIDRYLQLQKEYRPTWLNRIAGCLSGRIVFSISRQYGNFLTYTYPTIKLFYIFNLMMQFFILTRWLGPGYSFYGIEVLQSFLSNGYGTEQFPSSQIFPRVTWCDVPRRLVERKLEYQMHCVLPINLFNEIVFLVVWYWLVLVFILTVYNFVRWVSGCSFTGNDYIKKHLQMADRAKFSRTEEKKLIRKFIKTYLKSDGIFIIRLLSKNTSSVFVSDLLTDLYALFKATSDKDLVRNQQPNNYQPDSFNRTGLGSDDENEVEPNEINLENFMYTQTAEIKSRWGPQNPPQIPPHMVPPIQGGYNYRMMPPPPPPHSPGLNDFQLADGRRYRAVPRDTRDENNAVSPPNAPIMNLRENQ